MPVPGIAIAVQKASYQIVAADRHQLAYGGDDVSGRAVTLPASALGKAKFAVNATCPVDGDNDLGSVVADIGHYGATYVERPRGQALFSDILSSGIDAVICPASQRGRGPLASMKFAMRGADQSDAL